MPESQSGVHVPASHRRRRHPRLLTTLLVTGLIAAAGVGALVLGDPFTGPQQTGTPPSTEAAPTASAPDPAEEAAFDAELEVQTPPLSRATVTEVRPSVGSVLGGEAVVFAGAGFADPMSVRIGGRDAPVVEVLNSETARVTIPPGRPGPALLEVGGEGVAATPFEGLFTYVDQPARVVMAVRPNVGALAGGTLITIVGTGFEADARVVVGGERALDVTVIDSNRITAVTPAHEEGVVDLVVRNPQMPAAVLPESFEYVLGPTVTGVAPVEVRMDGGSVVVIEGTGFLPDAAVTFNGLSAPVVDVVDEFTIRVTAPPGAAGPAVVSVVNTDQPPAVVPAAVTFVVPPPEPGDEDLPDAPPAVPEPAPAAPETGSSAG